MASIAVRDARVDQHVLLEMAKLPCSDIADQQNGDGVLPIRRLLSYNARRVFTMRARRSWDSELVRNKRDDFLAGRSGPAFSTGIGPPSSEGGRLARLRSSQSLMRARL